MSQRVIINIVTDLAGIAVHCDQRRAGVTAAVVGPPVFIQCKTPLDEDFSGAAHDVGDFLEIGFDLIGISTDPGAAGMFGLIIPLGRKLVSQLEHPAGGSAIAMPCGSGHQPRRLDGGIRKDRGRIRMAIPVMVVNQQLGGDIACCKCWKHMVTQDRQLGGGIHVHPGVVAGYIQRLILQRDIVNWNALGFIGLDILHKIVGKRCIHARKKRPANHGAGILHPAGRAPWRTHDREVRIELQGLLEQRDDVRLIMRDAEIIQIGIRSSGRIIVVGIVETRQVRGSHRIAHKAHSDASADPREQIVHGVGSGGGRRHLVQQIGGGICKRCAEPFHLLVGLRFIHKHGIAAATAAGKRHRCLLLQLAALILCR